MSSIYCIATVQGNYDNWRLIVDADLSSGGHLQNFGKQFELFFIEKKKKLTCGFNKSKGNSAIKLLKRDHFLQKIRIPVYFQVLEL